MVQGDHDWADPLPPDPPYTHGGRPLANWLIELVSDDFSRRQAAGNAILAMAQPWRSLNPTTPEQLEQFKRVMRESEAFPGVVRRVVDEPSFPKAHFVRALCEYRVAVQERWERYITKVMDRQERVADRVQERYQADRSAPGADETFHRRLARVYAVNKNTRQESGTDADSAAYLVFEALDTAFLADPAALILVLRQRVLQWHAAQAMERIGPAGHDAFANLLLADLDAAADRKPFPYPRALAAVGKEDPELVRGLIRRALEGPPPAAAGALEALGEIGPPVLRYEPEFVWRVLRREPPGALFPFALSSAIGSIGRDDERLLKIILDYARPRPPRIVRSEGGHEWDATVSERGIALELLANFTVFPQRVVPVLMDALETFEEYDPDWSYERHEHGRVIASLRAFGPAAAPAVPLLARHLKTRDGDWDREVIRLLGELGPLAAEALPALEQLRAESDEPTPAEPNASAEPDKTLDPLDWSIWRIRHGHPR